MFPKKPTLALAFLPLATINPDAQLPIDDQARLTLGINATYHDSAFGAKNDLTVMPQAFYGNNRWYIEGSEAGFYPYKDANNHVRVGLSYDGRNFNPKDAKTDSLKSLDKRQWSVAAHASYMRVTPYGGFKVKVTTDTLGRSDGQTVSLSHLSKFKKDKLTVYPEFGITWQNRRYNQYYYGLSAAESDRSGLPAYDARSGTSRFATVTASYQLTDQISLFGNQRFEWLSTAQKNSPLTDASMDSKTRLGVNYKF